MTTNLPRRRSDAMSDPEDGWRGDEHRLQVSAADEAGLAPEEVSLDLFRKGFLGGLVVRDPLDHAVVLRGRTVLREGQLAAAIRRIFGQLHLGADAFRLRVNDGEFELRVASRVADAAGSSLDAMRRALLVWMICGLGGLLFLSSWQAVTLLTWGLGFLYGASILRRGLRDGRIRLAAHLVDELARLAAREQLILPPVGAGERPRALGSGEDAGA